MLVKSRATNHGIAVAIRSIAAAILVRWWRLGARSKAYDHGHQLEWSATDREASNLFQMDALLTPLI